MEAYLDARTDDPICEYRSAMMSNFVKKEKGKGKEKGKVTKTKRKGGGRGGGRREEEKKRIPTKFSIDLMASCRVSPFLKPDVKSSIGITLPPNRTICIEIYHCSLNFCNFFFFVCVCVCADFGTFWYFLVLFCNLLEIFLWYSFW